MKHILIIDDEADIRELLGDILEDEGYKISMAKNGSIAREKFSQERYDLILLDIWMPDIDGITLLSEFMSADEKPHIVMMSGHATVETAVEATQLGAYDFLEKPLSMAKLLLTIQNALKHSELVHENRKLKQDNNTQIIGSSVVMSKLRETIETMAQSKNLPVLILGEPGTDKTSIAKKIHQQSDLSKGPFIALAASTIALTDPAHELFGGQVNGVKKLGRFMQAQGGTLFISQIEELDLAAQSVLMAALDYSEFTPLNSNEKSPIQCKVIVSSNLGLAELSQDNNLREDLYYKLSVLTVEVPSLKNHSEDIPDLIQYFVDHAVAEYGLHYRHFSMPAQNTMRNHPWPGNMVELKNLVQRMLVMGGDLEVSQQEVIESLNPQAITENIDEHFLYSLDLKQAKNAFEKAYLLYHLQQNNSNVTKTAQYIGIERANIYRKLKAHNIDPRKS